MSFSERRPALDLPSSSRASRWTDIDVANRWTTHTLRYNETRLRAAAARGESTVEFRAPAPATSGTLFVRAGADIEPRDVSCAVVRMDLSGGAPVVRASLPEDLPLVEDAWDLLQVLSRFREDAVEDWLDPRQAVDDALAADPERAGAAAEQWHRLTGGATGGTAARQVLEMVTGSTLAPVEGRSWSAWAAWFVDNLDRTARSDVPAPTRDASRPDVVRTGEFDDGADLAVLVQEVLVHREGDVGSWLADLGGPVRLHVWADLGRVVGTVTTSGPDLDVAATAVALVLRRGADGTPEVLDAHPELPLDNGLRARFPVAATVLGAYFGSGTARLDVRPWLAQRALLADEPVDVLAAWRREVTRLLESDDADLARTVPRLGGAVVPANTRGWLERSLWRMDAFPLTDRP